MRQLLIIGATVSTVVGLFLIGTGIAGLVPAAWDRIRSAFSPRGKRRIVRLLKRWIRWKASEAKHPKGTEVEYRWIGIRNGKLLVDEYWTVLGEKIFRARKCLGYSFKGEDPAESYEDVLLFGAVPDAGCETPEELEMFLSGMGF